MPKRYHLSGKCGDIVYSLASVRAVSEACENERIDIVLAPIRYTDGYELTLGAIGSLMPLLKAQPYVGDVCVKSKDATFEGCLDFDDWFFKKKNYPANLCEGAFKYVMDWSTKELPISSIMRRWLEVGEVEKNGFVLVNRTGRYASENPRQTWDQMLDGVDPEQLRFIGLLEEHADLQSLLERKIQRIETPNLLMAAKLLAGCELLICNQSAPLAIATALDCAVRVETSSKELDSITLRGAKSAYYPLDDNRDNQFGFRWIENE